MWRPSVRLILLGLACTCVTACIHVGQAQVEPWRLLTLSPLPEAEQAKMSRASHGPAQAAVAIGPIHLAGYLDEDQIVTRISQNRLILSDNARWAEPLADNIAQVMAQDLSLLLQNTQVTVHLLPGQQRPAYQLAIEVLSFETDTAGTAYLAAQWLLRDVATRQTIAEKEVRLTVPSTGSSTEQSVASLSQALGDLSVGIGNVIREFVEPNTTQSAVGR